MQKSLEINITYNKNNKMPLLCVIAFQIHYKVMKIYRIWHKRFMNMDLDVFVLFCLISSFLVYEVLILSCFVFLCLISCLSLSSLLQFCPSVFKLCSAIYDYFLNFCCFLIFSLLFEFYFHFVSLLDIFCLLPEVFFKLLLWFSIYIQLHVNLNLILLIIIIK